MDKITRKKLLHAENYTSFQRIWKIQHCLKHGKSNADCVLVILGIDSKFCNGSRNLVETILPGFEDAATSITASVEFAEEAMDDLIICIKKDATSIYCNPQNYDFLMSYAACWSNLSVYCLNRNQYDEHEDLSEDLKMSSFIKMVEDCKVVAVPYYFGVPKQDEDVNFDPMIIEQWPLIQAFACEEIGGKGFFTMQYEVVDATDHLNEALSTFDSLALEILLTKQLPQFDRQWKTLIETMDVIGSKHLASLRECDISEPLQTYYRHAIGEKVSELSPSEYPVRFGVSTNRAREEQKFDTALGISGIRGSHAHHMICHGKDPKGILSCKRTYFFDSCANQVSSEENEPVKESNHAEDLKRLESLYILAVNAVDDSIKDYCQNLNIAKCKEIATSSVLNAATSLNLGFNPDVDVRFWSNDQHGREQSSENGTIKTIEVSIYDIPSVKYKDESLGSVVFSETFMTASISFSDQPDLKTTECIILTNGVPRFASWLTEAARLKNEELRVSLEEHSLEKIYGQCFINDATCAMVTGNWPNFDVKEVSIWGFESCLVIHHMQFGYIIIPLNQIKAWRTFDNDSAASPTVIVISPKPNLLSSLPFWLGKDRKVFLALLPKSKAHVGFYDKAFHFWMNPPTGYPPLTSVNALPSDLAKMYGIVEEIHKISDERELSIIHLFRVMPNLKRFFSLFELSSTIAPCLTKMEYDIMMSKVAIARPDVPADDTELLLTILTGLPGSGCENLSKSLTSLARESSRWLAIKVPSEIRDQFNVNALQDQLAITYRNFTMQKGRPQVTNRKRRRLILATQGFLDIKDVIQAINEHPDHHLRSKLIIGSVTCCINPANLFLFGRTLMPMALEQCTSGFVNNVVFTGCLEPDNASILADVQSLIRKCNRHASFMIAKSGEVSRTPDVEMILSETAFKEYSAIKSRILFDRRSILEKPHYVCQINIPFYQPVDRSRFLASLKAMKGQLGIENLFDDVILYMEGKIGFNGYPDVYEFKWCKVDGIASLSTTSKILSPRPPSSGKAVNGENASKYFVTFFGQNLQEHKLKEIMKSWKKQEKPLFLQKDIPEKKLKEIENLHKLDPLPPGWFFNGSQYVSFEGDKQFRHPSFNTFVDDYITSVNRDIQLYNDSIKHKDMFTKESI